MIRIAVVEDEKKFIDQTKEYFDRYQEEHHESLDITYFRDGDEIVSRYRSQFDIIFMDIQMKFMDGMTAAREIRKQDSQVIILFITNLSQYAIRGYEVGALDYILKPLPYFAFSQKLTQAIMKVNKKTRPYVTLNIKGGILRVELSDIYYIESDGHNLIYHTIKGDYTGAGTMKQAEENFTGMNFSRANKGYLINLEKVEGIRDKCAIVAGKHLLISRNRYEAFMKDMTNYWSEVD